MAASLNLATAWIDLKLTGFDKLQAGLNFMQNRLKQALAPVEGLALKGAGAITALTAAASPAAFSTLTGSFRLLAAVAGRELVPHIARFSFWIQQSAVWLRNLDPQVKKNAASILAWGTAITGVVMVGGRLVGVLLQVGRAVVGLLANPLAAAFTATAAAIGYATYNLMQFNAAAEASIEKRDRLNAGRVKQSDINDDPILGQVLNEKDLNKRAVMAEKLLAINENTRQRLLQEQVAQPLGQQGLGKLLGDDKEKLENIGKLTHRMSILRQIAAEARGGKKMEVEKDAPNADERKRQMKLDRLLLAGPGNGGTASFSDLSSVFHKIQAQAMKDPLEMEILKIQQEQLEELRKIAAKEGGPAMRP